MKTELLTNIHMYLSTVNTYDDVSFADFIIDKDKFNLSKEEFITYIEIFIKYLFENEGLIVLAADKDDEYDWIETNEYGLTPKDIACNLYEAYEKYAVENPDEDNYKFGYRVWFVKNSKFVKKLNQ